MAERYDDRYRDRWSERERDRNQEWDERHEQARSRGWQGYSSSPSGGRERDRPEYEDYPPSRYRNDYSRDQYRRGNEFESERGREPGAAYRSGYVGRNAFIGDGGYESHVGGYNQPNERGYGATSSGANWGASEPGRHRLGTLTDSAAQGARYVDQRSGSHSGRGPKNYQRSDERITDEICERLTRDPEIDATNIEITVQSGLVTLGGFVGDRQSKRAAEDLANDVWGVKDVQNQIKIQRTDLLTSGGTNANASTNVNEPQTTPPVVGHGAVPTTRH